MAGVFQPNVFQHNVFQVVGAIGSAGETVLTDKHRRGHGSSFSRKKWRKLQDELNA